MLLVRRLATALVLFVFIFVVTSVGALMIGGGIAGAQAGAEVRQGSSPGSFGTNFDDGFARGARAGVKFRQEYGKIILLGALGLAAVGSLGLSFTGVLPWCRERKPPPLPPNVH